MLFKIKRSGTIGVHMEKEKKHSKQKGPHEQRLRR